MNCTENMITEDISGGKERMMLPVVNEIDDQTPSDFGVSHQSVSFIIQFHKWHDESSKNYISHWIGEWSELFYLQFYAFFFTIGNQKLILRTY